LATCKICLDHVPPSHLHHASRGCAHAFCTVCLSDYISAKTQGGRISDIKCPGDGEDCCNVLDPELSQGVISGEAFEALCAALCRSMVEGAGNFCYCPFNDCSEILVDDRGGDVPESECPACRRLFCARCRVPWHAGISCAEYGQLAPGDKGKEDLVVLEMAKGEKWKRCPNCKFLVDKRDGCVHMTCR
jgi:E3 ubiquitin-protein ligase RNF144